MILNTVFVGLIHLIHTHWHHPAPSTQEKDVLCKAPAHSTGGTSYLLSKQHNVKASFLFGTLTRLFEMEYGVHILFMKSLDTYHCLTKKKHDSRGHAMAMFDFPNKCPCCHSKGIGPESCVSKND